MKKTALFIDFDNIYSGLQRVTPQAADAFATDPGAWVRWLESGMPSDDASSEAEPRRILVRRCYLNPRVYQKYRAYFVLAGFDVVDCPPLTQQGKTSADIRMAMDVLDTLGHQTHFDEFVILSGDADFTPVLLRLRAHDRRTVILAVGFAAQAYKAACDIVISEGAFIETALGISGDEEPGQRDFDDGDAPHSPPPPAEASAPPLDLIARDVALAAAKGPVASADLPSIYRRQAVFRASTDWLGYGTLRAMTEAVIARRTDLQMSPGNPWVVSLRPDAAAAAPRPDAAAATAPRPDRPDAPRPDAPPSMGVARPDRPDARPAPPPEPPPGPPVPPGAEARRPTPPRLRAPGRGPYSLTEPSGPTLLEQFARRISQVTGAPLLRPSVYAAVFRAAAEYLAANEFELYTASRDVVKLTAAQGAEVSRTAVVFILRGIAYGGLDLGRAPSDWSPADLAQSFRDNLALLCADRGLALSDAESLALDRWLIKRLDPRPEAPPASTALPRPPPDAAATEPA